MNIEDNKHEWKKIRCETSTEGSKLYRWLPDLLLSANTVFPDIHS